MPWELTIHRADGAPLGDFATVREQIISTVPAMKFYREGSGQEKIEAARAKGIEFPDVILRHFEQMPAKDNAVFEGDGFLIALYGFEATPLTRFHVEVRGNGSPVPVLAAMCLPNDWIVTDCASGQPINLSAEEVAG